MEFAALKCFMDDMAAHHTPGNAVKVYLGGKLVFQYASGYADLETQTPMTGEELFNIYSCSKIATATAGVQLLEQGRMGLEDPLYAYIPEFREMLIKNEHGDIVRAKNPITIRHLFTMTAGFSYDLKADGFQKAKELTGGSMDTVETFRCVAKDPLCFEPGTHWQYSICHDVLAAVISVVSGKTFREYMKTNIFDPLDMKDTDYHHTEKTLKRTATQYTYVVNGKETTDLVQAQKRSNGSGGIFRVSDKTNSAFILGPEYDSGGAGIITTVSDYAKLMAALADRRMGLTGERILSAEAVEMMRTNRLKGQLMKDWELDWTYLAGYGYGLGVCTHMNPGRSGIQSNPGEFGWGGAAGSTGFVDPEIRLGVFYAQHTLNPREEYYQPRLKNAVYSCL